MCFEKHSIDYFNINPYIIDGGMLLHSVKRTLNNTCMYLFLCIIMIICKILKMPLLKSCNSRFLMDMKMMEGRCSETQDTVQGEEGDKETEKPEAKESGGKETVQGISQESSRKKSRLYIPFFWERMYKNN